MGISMATAEAWVERWERQQQRYAIDREERFDVIADVVEHATAGLARPLLVELGCGPGSLASRLARRTPNAEIVAVDRDPVLLELGRTHHADAARWVEAVLGDAGWAGALGLDRAADAVVSSTALHCLPEEALARTYRDAAALLRPGGVLVNADHFPSDGALCSRLTAHVGRRRQEAAPVGQALDWESWWAAAARDPELADAFAQRALRPAPGDPDEPLTLSRHVRLLRAAGFRQVCTVWQYGQSRVLVAVT
ncbi:class I SAM-dependent methyltransferase [Streptomyces marincola]|uniref:Methyltransferase n=1 Tax=Streptomyces marincola TaxID=2878388 RepID=A0A1W7CWE4_9ACTN|nr:class I SAM-dependent methyltransferase [Streptomyces marincola]ARQ69121.1 methyltransferase [Streptomyces marincola]